MEKNSKISQLSEEQENILEKNIVWVFGSARSGTTWLSRDLLSYDACWLNEPLIGRHIGYALPTRIDQIRDIDFFSSAPRYFFCEKYKETWIFYLRKLILNRIHAQFKTFSKKIIIKEPNGSNGADILSECTPNSKILILLRDGRDVVDSHLDARKEGSKLQTRFKVEPVTKETRNSFIIESAYNWNRTMAIILKAYENHNQKLRYLLKYEDLRYNTLNELKKIYQFLDVEISEENLIQLVKKYSFENIPDSEKGGGKVQRSATPNKWKNSFSSKEKNILEKIMGPMLKKVGYQV